MRAIKGIFFLLMMMSTFTLVAMETKQTATAKPSAKSCATREACLNDPNCLCWCSQICGWRKKTPEDHPVYIENDKYGKFCYCKQWDYDNYEANCINGKKIKQPKGAK